MNYLSIEKLSKSFSHKVLFEDISFGISKGEKVGLVAKNGSGKSTLLKILAGLEAEDSGEVAFRNGIKIGVLDQHPEFDENMTVMEAVYSGSGEIIQVLKEYEMSLLNPDDQDRMQAAFGAMDDSNAWDYESRIKQILGQLKITNLQQSVSELSGGQVKRVAMAQTLIDEPDFLILDEPTNHLDVDIIEWLEEFLTKSNMTLFMVTHDRYFLENICTTILEIDGGEMFRYEGSYSVFLTKKEEREAIARQEVTKAKNLFSKELEWMRRQPKARGTKAKYRVDAFHEIKGKAHKKFDDSKLELGVQSTRMGKKILELENVSKRFDDLNILDDFTYTFKRKEKVGIVGKNGVGKSTFLNIIAGLEKQDSGDVVKGETIKVGYYHQKGIQLKDDKRVIDVVKDIAEYIEQPNGEKITASRLLEKFLFAPETQYSPVSKLSGGEKRRLYLLTVLIENPNFLILDEPTNDLDIVSLTILEEFLLEYDGCLMVVSHDRFFMDKLVDHLFVFEGNGIVKDFNGRYNEYRDYIEAKEIEEKQLKEDAKNNKVVEKKEIAPAPQPEKKKLSYKEQKELTDLDEWISSTELKLKALETELASITDVDKITALSEEFQRLSEELEEKTLRWLELSE